MPTGCDAMTQAVRYRFGQCIPRGDVEICLALAVVAAESLHGQARVRLDADYRFDPDRHECVVAADSEIGRDLCRIFTAFLTREFGEDTFRAERVDSHPFSSTFLERR